jgi:hypothetical protein
MSKNELQAMIVKAEMQRKEAYKLRMPRLFIQSVNRQIRDLQAALAEVA